MYPFNPESIRDDAVLYIIRLSGQSRFPVPVHIISVFRMYDIKEDFISKGGVFKGNPNIL